MALMQWNDTMSVDVEELDEQHKQLIALINEAYEAIQRHDEHKMSELIDKMRDYAILHFETEERYLEQYDYPDIEAHKALHAKFNEDVDEFKRNLYDRTNLSQIFVFLSRWLTNHIMNEDKQYSSCLPKDEKGKD